jgi:hypothetical protein
MEKSVYSLPALRGPACRQPPLLGVHLHPRRSECWAGETAQAVSDRDRPRAVLSFSTSSVKKIINRFKFSPPRRVQETWPAEPNLTRPPGREERRPSVALVEKLRLRRFIRKVGHAYRHCLTHFGKEIIAAAWRSKSCCSFYNSPSAPRRNSNSLAVSDRILKHRD